MFVDKFLKEDTQKFLKDEIVPLISKETKKIIDSMEFQGLLKESIEYCILSGGKKLRPALCLVVSKCFDKEINEAIIPAIASEILHNALLVHDDIIDGDEIRRNKPTVWKKYGINQAINIGDAMLILTYKILEKYPNTIKRDKMYKYTNLTYLKTIEGQILEEILKNKDDPTLEEYIEMITKKTAYYLTYPIVLGLIVGDKEEYIPKIFEYGKNIGIAFQIQDDYLDLTLGKGRMNIGNDIKEGKRSVFVILLLKKAKEKNKILEILNKPRHETTQEDINFILTLFKKYNIYDEVNNLKEQYLSKALNIAEEIDNEKLKKVLVKFANYMINRNE